MHLLAFSRFCFGLSLCIAIFCCQQKALAEPLHLMAEVSGFTVFYKQEKLSGYAIDIIRELQRRTGHHATIQTLPWARAFRELQERANTGLILTARTKERDPMFHWVGPFLRLKWILLGRKSDHHKISSLDDARQIKSIGTYIGDVRDSYLRKNKFTNLEPAPNAILNFRKLAERRVELITSADIKLGELDAMDDIDVNQFETVYVLKESDLYLAISPHTPMKTVKLWQKHFENMKKDGTFQSIFKKWYPHLSPPMTQKKP